VSTVAARALRLLLRAGLLTGVVDGIFASTMNIVVNHSTAGRLFRGVASTVLGKQAMNGGAPATAVGVLMHFGVAFGWSALFLLLVLRWGWLRRALASAAGVAVTAMIYGPLVFLVMSLVVIPLLVHAPTPINARWWMQLIGHIPFVGLPIVASLRRA